MSSSSSSDFTALTFVREQMPPKQVKSTNLTPQELTQLKQDDPFAFYSLPAVKEAIMSGRSINMSAISAASSSSGSTGTSSNGNYDQAKTKTVERKRRISYESYPDITVELNSITLDDLLLEDFLTDDDDYEADWEDDHQALGQ